MLIGSAVPLFNAATDMADKAIGYTPNILREASAMPVMGTFSVSATTGETTNTKPAWPTVSDARTPPASVTTTATTGTDFTAALNSLTGNLLSMFGTASTAGAAQGGSTTTAGGLDKTTVLLALGVAAAVFFITKKG